MNEMPDMATIMSMMNSISSNNRDNIPKSENVLDEIAKFQDANSDTTQATNPTNSSENIPNGQNHSSTNSNSTPDIETMMHIMKVVSSMNSSQNNASTNLLNSLRPFLRDSKKEKIDQYIQFIKMSNAISELNHFGGEKK